MDTAERIVEAYVRYVKGCATIPNIGCPGQGEIDLLAINPKTMERFHIETSVSISGGFSKLTGKPFDEVLVKDRVKAPEQRRTVGFFVCRKFANPGVLGVLADHGFLPGEYRRVIVTWGATTEAREQAKNQDVDLWDFPDLIRGIATHISDRSCHFGDDTLRTLHLYTLAIKESK